MFNEEILYYSFWGNEVKAWLIALGVFLLAFIVLKIFKSVLIGRLKALSEKTKNRIDDMVVKAINSIHAPFYFWVAVFIASHFLVLNNIASKTILYIFLIAVVYYVVKFIEDLIEYFFDRLEEKKEKTGDNVGMIKLAQVAVKIILWIGAIVLILSNMGYNVTSLVAGLGIGGIAIALAIQNILSDLFSSLSIYFDKPFAIGDFIIVGDDMGTVKKIGIKTTRIQTLQGEELVISNSELTTTRINNYGKMQKRRIVFEFGVTYDTPKAKLEKISGYAKEVIEAQEEVQFDRAHFKSFGDSALIYEIVYYKMSGDYNQYMNTQQAINIGLVGRFEKEKIEFAFPTQTVYIKK